MSATIFCHFTTLFRWNFAKLIKFRINGAHLLKWVEFFVIFSRKYPGLFSWHGPLQSHRIQLSIPTSKYSNRSTSFPSFQLLHSPSWVSILYFTYSTFDDVEFSVSFFNRDANTRSFHCSFHKFLLILRQSKSLIIKC